jgi:hypothetical protein
MTMTDPHVVDPCRETLDYNRRLPIEPNSIFAAVNDEYARHGEGEEVRR